VELCNLHVCWWIVNWHVQKFDACSTGHSSCFTSFIVCFYSLPFPLSSFSTLDFTKIFLLSTIHFERHCIELTITTSQWIAASKPNAPNEYSQSGDDLELERIHERISPGKEPVDFNWYMTWILFSTVESFLITDFLFCKSLYDFSRKLTYSQEILSIS